jgi:hypothetical protein
MNTNAFPIKSGLYFQVYLDALRRSDKRKALEDFVKSPLLGLGISVGVVGHDFPKDRSIGGFSSPFDKRASEIVSTILGARATPPLAGLAYGLDGSSDHDGTRLTAKEKGERMGLAVVRSKASLLLPNAETAWDRDEGPEDDMDEDGALEMGRAVRAMTDVVVIDQPWPMPEQHGDNRRIAKPIGQGGSFAGFPIDEFGSWVDVRAPQFYWANWYRYHQDKAYSRIYEWMEREWKSVEEAMRRSDPTVLRPRTTTIQGYGHDTYPWTLGNHLIRNVTTKPIIVWSDPTPTPSTIEIIRVVDRVVSEAAAAGLHPVEYVGTVQRRAGLTVDKIVGPKTWSVLAG